MNPEEQQQLNNSQDEMQSANDEQQQKAKGLNDQEKALRAAKRQECLQTFDGQNILNFSYPDFRTQNGKLKENQSITFMAVAFNQNTGLMEIGRAVWNLNDFHKIKESLKLSMKPLANYLKNCPEWICQVSELQIFKNNSINFWNCWIDQTPNNGSQLKSMISEIEEHVSAILEMMTQSGGKWSKENVEFLTKYQNRVINFNNHLQSINIKSPMSKVEIERKHDELAEHHFKTARNRLMKYRSNPAIAKRQWQFNIPIFETLNDLVSHWAQKDEGQEFSKKEIILQQEKKKFFKLHKNLNPETHQFTPEEENMLVIRSVTSPKKHQLSKFSHMSLVRGSVLGWYNCLGQIAVAKSRAAPLLNPPLPNVAVPPV